MKEYSIVTFPIRGGVLSEMTGYLNAGGADGWTLFKMDMPTEGNQIYTVVMERDIPQAQPDSNAVQALAYIAHSVVEHHEMGTIDEELITALDQAVGRVNQ